MNEYRCTRFYPYRSPGCPGFTDPTTRQGYYIDAPNMFTAMQKMAKQFPVDVERSKAKGFEPFTVTIWKSNVGTQKVSHAK